MGGTGWAMFRGSLLMFRGVLGRKYMFEEYLQSQDRLRWCLAANQRTHRCGRYVLMRCTMIPAPRKQPLQNATSGLGFYHTLVNHQMHENEWLEPEMLASWKKEAHLRTTSFWGFSIELHARNISFGIQVDECHRLTFPQRRLLELGGVIDQPF